MTVAFDQAYASSDGGLLLLKALDARLGVTTTQAGDLRDGRQPGKIQYAVLDLVHKLALDRDPLTGAALGSQPTRSRFENAISRPALGRAVWGGRAHVRAVALTACMRKLLTILNAMLKHQARWAVAHS